MYTNPIINSLFPAARYGYESAFPVDIEETPKALVVHAEVPGYGQDELEVGFREGVLTIAAAKAEAKDEDAAKKGAASPIYRERASASMRRQFRFKADIDAAKIGAKLANGVLSVTLPKRKSETAGPRIKIAVE